jgi:hypothetical protein
MYSLQFFVSISLSIKVQGKKEKLLCADKFETQMGTISQFLPELSVFQMLRKKHVGYKHRAEL